MKKILALLAAAGLCLAALSGCTGGAAAPSSSSAPESQSVSSAPEVSVSSTAAEEESQEEFYSQDVDITNSTGVDILEMYISLSDVDNWEEDLLAGSVFAADETMQFTTDIPGTADTTWDIKAVDADGDEITFTEINLSSATALELHWGADGKTPTVSITGSGEEEYFSQDLDITNATGVAILEVYISTSDDNMWGEDMLGEEIFPAGETLHFSTELTGTADATWDIKIVDEDGDEVVFEGVSFSSASALTLHWGEDGATPTVSYE